MIGGLLPLQTISYFKISEGGWEDPGSGRVARTPDETLTDVDAIINPGRYAADERYVFTKSFVGGDIVFSSPTTVSCTCLLDFGDANDDGYGNDPEFWEIGIFDSDDNMLAHGTFPQQTKNISVQLSNTVNFVF